jgi:hypothetical protein
MKHPPAPVTYEIRLRRMHEDLDDRLFTGAEKLWLPDTPDNRRMLREAVERGNEHYGEQTHWIEVRKA